MEATNVFDSDGKPMEAILVLFDVTEQREKEAVYKKWQQSLQEKALDSYTLFRCNLNKNASFDSAEGTLLKIKFSPMSLTFNDRTMEYARKYVYFEDRKNYMAILNSDTMLANYYRGKRVDSFEYREKVSENRVRWLKLSIELVEYPNSNDIEAFLMYEDIDEYKKDEILTKELARTDPLTGVLNRNAFSDKMQAIISNSKRDERHAFLMLDIDGFKQINDGFGHAAGDEALVKIARSLRCVLGQGDLLGRLGGDEFLLCLKNVPDDKFIAYKAERMCALVRSGSKPDIKLSVSIGIAVYPSDGKDFDALYHRADTALYRVKENGKDNFGFYASQKTQNVE